MTHPLPHDEPERDAWLREALRHAPDARAEPSAALSETILRQARAAATPAAPPHRPGPWRALAALWSRLARPPVAAGFASVMVATLVGLMWWDRPLDETLSRPPASAPALPSVAPATPPAPAAPPPQRSAPEPLADSRAERTAMPAPAPPAAAPTARTRDAAPSTATAEMAPAARDESIAAAPGIATTRGLAKAAAPTATTPLAELRASIAAQPQRWAWQRGGSVQPMTPALQHWLLQLDRATAPHWQTSPGPAAQGEGLRLYHDGVLHTSLRLDAAAALLTSASGGHARAALAPAPLAALKRALDEAAP